MHATMIEECHAHWRRHGERKRYDPTAEVKGKGPAQGASLFAKRIRKVHAAGLIPTCSAEERLTGRHVVKALCEGARELRRRYAGTGHQRHWEPAEATDNSAAAEEARPSDMHGANILNQDPERALAVEDLVFFAHACGMSALSFELPGEAEALFDRHVELVVKGLRMEQDGRRFVHEHLLDGTAHAALSIPEAKAPEALNVAYAAIDPRSGQETGGMMAVRRAAPGAGTPLQIYLDRQFFWVRLHELPPQLSSIQAYYIDRSPDAGSHEQAWQHIDVLPMPHDEVGKTLQIEKLEVFGKPGAGRMAVLLVHEDHAALGSLPWRLDGLMRSAVQARQAATRDGGQETAQDLENRAHAERVKWLVCSLPSERLWLARRDYVLSDAPSRGVGHV